MLLQLNIKDLAIIDNLEISFGKGLNVFTGETGAGKSIIIDALDLTLGDRASGELIRSGSEEARVEALFDISGMEGIDKIIKDAGIPFSDTLTVARIILRSGKNKIFLNGALATLTTLAEVGRRLIDIYGQSEHQSLTRAEEHIEIYDGFLDVKNLRRGMSETYKKWVSVKKEFERLNAGIKESIGDRELLIFQSKEIAEANLKKGEDEELKKERERLKNAVMLSGAAENGERALYSEEGSVIGRVAAVARELRDAVRFDPNLDLTVKRLESSLIELKDISGSLRDYAESLQGDPERLEGIEERLDTISKLKKKYGATIEEIFQKKDSIDKKLFDISNYNERLKTLESSLDTAAKEASQASNGLTVARKKKRGEFKKAIEKELLELGMKGAAFEVSIETENNLDGSLRFGEKGGDHVRFLISTNIGEEPKPLSKIASGGELSRIMLAVKTLTSVGKIPTLVFDEIDSGVGGPMAGVVGKKIKGVSAKGHQILCITHMPQIAVFGDSHYHVAKVSTKEGRTVTRVKKLIDSERVEYIAWMLGGAKATETQRKHAKELLKSTEGG